MIFTEAEPRGVAARGDLTFVATINDIKILKEGKVVAQDKPKYNPTTIAANPTVQGEFAVGGSDVESHLAITNI